MNTSDFSLRHIGTIQKNETHMLKTIGVDSLEQLIHETIPNDIKLKNPLKLDKPLSEYDYLNHIHALGNENKLFKNYIGLGYHPTITPAVIQRNIFENLRRFTITSTSHYDLLTNVKRFSNVKNSFN
jgi:glycine dehydrogenase